ncbi:MAG: tripartite tricarboxylate transporter substrate binding protein [Xanthobacteraceae bacterium]|nr:tripartite tricarboxylate transporter substrate binding protein [Xanthobacteraceae bacterium]
MKRAVLAGCAASILALAAAATVNAQGNYPDRPAQIIVPFPPGGNTDILTRVMADQFSAALKQPFTVTNKPGAGANIGAGFVASSEPDGYTLLMAPPATHAINAYLYNTLPFDMEKSFAPITMVAQFPNVLVVHPSLGVKSIEELIAKAKAEPGKIDFANSGVGSTSHLCISLFMAMAGIEINHIPYKGTGQSIQDLITGRVPATIDNLGPILPHIQAGTLIALGVSTATPVAVLPDVRPIGAVVKGYQAASWNALSAPAKTPRPIVSKLSVEANAILKKPEVIEKFRAIGSEPIGGTPDEIEKYFVEERARWKQAVEVAKLQKM